jgi:glycosyltransferase involved in cell wall biosynthesis
VQHEGQLKDLPSQWKTKALLVRSIAGRFVEFKPHSFRETYVAWVGMLRQPKRPDLLTYLAQQLPQVKFVVCGGATTHRSPSGYSKNVIDRLKNVSNIDFRSQVAPEEAEQVIAEAAVLLCTSEKEGFPNTFLQAWSHGTPVVTLQVDPDSLIQQLGLGIVTGTVDAAIDQLKQLLSSVKEREIIAVRARDYVSRHHSEEVVVKAFDQATRLAC